MLNVLQFKSNSKLQFIYSVKILSIGIPHNMLLNRMNQTNNCYITLKIFAGVVYKFYGSDFI